MCKLRRLAGRLANRRWDGAGRGRSGSAVRQAQSGATAWTTTREATRDLRIQRGRSGSTVALARSVLISGRRIL